MNKNFSYLAFFTLFFIVIGACNDKHNENSKNDIKGDNQVVSTIPGLIGKWGGLGEITPVWDIRKDSIYYVQQSKAYFYKIDSNNMIVELENSPVVFKNIHVNNDTLFFTDGEGLLIRGYRFK